MEILINIALGAVFCVLTVTAAAFFVWIAQRGLNRPYEVIYNKLANKNMLITANNIIGGICIVFLLIIILIGLYALGYELRN